MKPLFQFKSGLETLVRLRPFRISTWFFAWVKVGVEIKFIEPKFCLILVLMITKLRSNLMDIDILENISKGRKKKDIVKIKKARLGKVKEDQL